VPKIIINDTITLFFKTAISILVISTSLRVGGRVVRRSCLPGLCRGGGRQAGAPVALSGVAV